ncbi:hypothetical protein ScPMuIL_010137 [Solemya velum]
MAKAGQNLPEIKSKRLKQYMELRERNQTVATGVNDPRVPRDIEKMTPDDPQLIDVIRDIWIDQPSTEPYNLHHSYRTFSQFKEDTIVDKLMEGKRDGFFIEAGAVDGEFLSNSLFFEMHRNWSGLLIEADPVSYSMLKTKHRKAYSINACLASHVTKMSFYLDWNTGGIDEYFEVEKKDYQATVYCFPLQAILHAIKQTTVDLFSLDVEGAEPYVLKGIDFDKVDIKMFLIEYNLCGLQPINEILEPVGYKVLRKDDVNVIYIKQGTVPVTDGLEKP